MLCLYIYTVIFPFFCLFIFIKLLPVTEMKSCDPSLKTVTYIFNTNPLGWSVTTFFSFLPYLILLLIKPKCWCFDPVRLVQKRLSKHTLTWALWVSFIWENQLWWKPIAEIAIFMPLAQYCQTWFQMTTQASHHTGFTQLSVTHVISPICMLLSQLLPCFTHYCSSQISVATSNRIEVLLSFF